jgi:hypothetical protein
MVAKIALAAASTMASLAGAASAYKMAGAQSKSAAAQVESAKRAAEMDAAVQSSERMKRFEQATSSQLSAAAARGVELDSFDAIRRDDQRQVDSDLLNIRANTGNRLRQLDLYGYDAELSARSRQMAAISTGTRSLFDFGKTVYNEWPASSEPARFRSLSGRTNPAREF